jgi:DNA-binding response OmpR family regulator
MSSSPFTTPSHWLPSRSVAFETVTNILIVEPERRLAETLSEHLRRHGYATTVCASQSEALPYLIRRIPDLLILDACSSDAKTRDLFHEAQQAHHIPTIVLGSIDDPSAGVAALDGGADDFLLKPFSLAEATARVRALSRRCAHT